MASAGLPFFIFFFMGILVVLASFDAFSLSLHLILFHFRLCIFGGQNIHPDRRTNLGDFHFHQQFLLVPNGAVLDGFHHSGVFWIKGQSIHIVLAL